MKALIDFFMILYCILGGHGKRSDQPIIDLLPFDRIQVPSNEKFSNINKDISVCEDIKKKKKKKKNIIERMQ